MSTTDFKKNARNAVQCLYHTRNAISDEDRRKTRNAWAKARRWIEEGALAESVRLQTVEPAFTAKVARMDELTAQKWNLDNEFVEILGLADDLIFAIDLARYSL